MNRKKAVVLLVDDSEADQEIVQRALEDGKMECTLLLANHGEEALQLLRHEGPFTDKIKYPKPDLILLDINMPVMDGRSTLKAIREDEALKRLPVIMLTTSNYDKDVIDSYNLGVNAFLTKPVSYYEFVDKIAGLETFWFELVVLPPH